MRLNNSLILMVAGGIAALGYAPFYAWPVALLALAFLAHKLCKAPSLSQGWRWGFWFGLGHFAAGLYWLPRAFWQESGSLSFALLGGVPGLLLLAGYCALYVGFVGLATGVAAHRSRALGLAVFACVWLLAELVRAHFLYGFPWHLLGSMGAGDAALLKLVSWGDVWLASLFLAGGGALLAYGQQWCQRFKAGVAIALVYGVLWAVPTPAPNVPELPAATWLLVQGNVTEQQQWDSAARWQQLQTYLDLTAAHNSDDIDVVVWPETAVMFLLSGDSFARAEIAKVLRPGQQLVTGVPRRDEAGRYYNSMQVINADGSLAATYDKRLLVPFGEFVPARQWIPDFWEIGRFVRQYVDYSPGTGAVTLPAGAVSTLPLICYEAIFPGFVQRHRAGNAVLLNITNDAWFDGTTAPAQHFAMARLRAAATGKPLVRVANTGHTAVVDGNGHIVQQLPPRRAGHLKVNLSDLY